MGTVRLLDHVINGIQQEMYELFVEAEDKNLAEYVGDKQIIITKAYKVFMDSDEGKLLAQAPSYWNAKVEHLKVELRTTTIAMPKLRVDHKTTLGKIYTIPLVYTGIGMYGERHRFLNLKDDDLTHLPVTDNELYLLAKAKINRYERKAAEINDEKKKMWTSAKEVIDQCSTVNQVLKIWPACERFLNQDIKDRLATKRKPYTKREIAKAKEDLNLDELNKEILKKVL